MGMYDEVYCDASLPDGREPRDTWFQTKSFPDPCMCRYRITSAGRLIDSLSGINFNRRSTRGFRPAFSSAETYEDEGAEQDQ